MDAQLKHILDLSGAGLSLTATLLFVPASVWAWPFSLAAILVNGFLYYQLAIYGDFCLEIIYAVLSIYGWYHWLQRGSQSQSLAITYLPRAYYSAIAAIAVIGTISIYSLLAQLGSTVAWLDASTTTVSIIAQWMTARKYIQCWFLWLAADLAYIFMYAIKGIPFHSVMVFVYCFIAVVGFISWQRKMSEQTDNNPIYDAHAQHN